MKYIINGPSIARGQIKISGAKNFSVKALALSLLQNGLLEYNNVPDNLDVAKTLAMLSALGAHVDFDACGKNCKVNTTNVRNVLTDSNNANMVTFLLGAALIHKFDYVEFPKPAGCALGKRADDFHIMAFEKFGISCQVEDKYILKRVDKITACDIVLPYPSVGATETALFLAARAHGISRIFNAAIEPEIQALITAMITMGANIFFINDRDLIIYGVQELHNNTKIEIHGDLLEAASWAVMAAATRGEIIIDGVIPELIGSFLGIFNLLGGVCERISENSMRFSSRGSIEKTSESILIETGVFPKLRTDLQPLLAILAGINNIKAIVHDTVYDDRVRYVETFRQFGINAYASSECFDNKCRFDKAGGVEYMHTAIIDGCVDGLVEQNQIIEPTTIRSGMAKIILAAAVRGQTVIDHVEIIERGYCNLFNKLKGIGVDIRRE